MESTKQKTFRSKSLNRLSVRRKNSFNKVRLLFENSKTVETKRNSEFSSTNKSVKELDFDSNTNSLKVIEERINCDLNYEKQNEIMISNPDWDSSQFNSLSNDETFNENSSDKYFVKNKIMFFEKKSNNEKIDAKNLTKNIREELKYCDNFCDNYGNGDNYEKSNDLQLNDFNKDKNIEEINTSFKSISIEVKCDNQNDLTNDFNNSLNNSSKIESNLIRSLSVSSVSSMTSDFVSFSSESDVVFRKPLIKTEDILTVRPVPKQRTSLIKNNQKNETENYFNINLDSIKLNEVIETKRQSERISVRSQDSGISDSSQNTSFLWNKILSSTSDENQKHEINCETEDESNAKEEQNEQIYDHIYEELSNCLSLSSSEWIDIESDDSNQIKTFKPELHLNRKSQFYNTNNCRISFRPKVNRRKINKSIVFRSSNESIDSFHNGSGSRSGSRSGSATEYEDIDEDYENNLNFVGSENSTKEVIPEKLEIKQKFDHIYELMSDKEDIPKKEFVRKKVTQSNSIDNTNKMDDPPALNFDKTFVECKPNIYTSTPRRLPVMELKNEIETNKRDSLMSRNSSIYINPNSFQSDYLNENQLKISGFPNLCTKRRAETFQNQVSVTASIASYLELSIGSENNGSQFKSEPLYQFYQNDVRRRAQLWIHLDQNISDIEYETYENKDESDGQITSSIQLNSCLNVNKNDEHIHNLFKRNKSTIDWVSCGPNRSLWCQLPQVINSKDNLLKSMSDKEKRLQESMFEIITSEASYCKSLNILVSHFYNCNEFSGDFPQILNSREKKCLFSNITEITKISSSLLSELEKRFEQNILLYDVCDIIQDYAFNSFQPYIRYCAYQRDQEKLLTQLTQSRSAFVDVLQRLESNQICQNQNLLSFLLLPLQRITRYPLLIDAVCQQLSNESPILDSVRKALGFANQLVRKCNEETKKVQRMQELIEIEKILHFRSKIKSYPIVSGARYLVKRGSVLRLSPQMSNKKTIGKHTLKWSKSTIHLFLFSDLLIVAKKKSENNYSVFDYCSRNTVQLIPLTNNGEEQGLISNFRIPIPRNHENMAQLIFLHNHESKTVEYTISFQLESEKLRWIEAVSQPSSNDPNEVIYEEWDCPQVQCIKNYCAQQTDEISLEETDVLNVFRKIKDGWFEGQRIRDGVKGWFPSNYTEEIINQHVRARNIKLRHRLLMYTQSVIEEQKKTLN